MTATKPKTSWTSIAVTAGLGFCASVQFTLYFASCWTYLQSLDSTVSETFYGAVVSGYSLGQILGAPLVGYWSNRIENIRIPVTACLICSFTGNLIYIFAQLSADYGRFFVLIARFIVGIGAGNIGLLKSYASMASTTEDRSRSIALVAGGVAFGSTCGPAIQLLFTPIGYPGVQLSGRIWFNMFTAPAFAACLINVVGLCFLWALFEENCAGLAATKKSGDDSEPLPKYDLLAVFVVHATFFAQRFTFTNLETLGAPIGQSIFAWTKAEVVTYIGIAHSCVSVCALVINITFATFRMEKILNFRVHCVCAIVGLILFHLVTFSWPFLPGYLQTYSQKEYDYAVANGTEVVGCNRDRFGWCESVKPMNVWVYYVAYVLFIGTCFPSINITLTTLFSKILGPRRMSTEQGLLQMTGSTARLTGPLLISNLYTNVGPRYAWILELVVLSAVILLWSQFYKRMVPLRIPERANDLNRTSIHKDEIAKSNNNSLKN